MNKDGAKEGSSKHMTEGPGLRSKKSVAGRGDSACTWDHRVCAIIQTTRLALVICRVKCVFLCFYGL